MTVHYHGHLHDDIADEECWFDRFLLGHPPSDNNDDYCDDGDDDSDNDDDDCDDVHDDCDDSDSYSDNCSDDNCDCVVDNICDCSECGAIIVF